MMHPKHRIEGRCAARAHMSGEVGVVYSVVQILQSANRCAAVARVGAGNLSESLVLRQDIIEKGA